MKMTANDFQKIKIGRSVWNVPVEYSFLLPIQAGYGGVICRAQLVSSPRPSLRIKQINLPVGTTLEPDSNKRRLGLIYREIRLVKHVNHANLAKFVDLFAHDQSIYLVTHSPGIDLKKLLETEENESETISDDNKKLSLVKQMFNGLNYLHNLGVIHKDLQPVNIVIDEQSHLRIINFDLVRTGKYDPNSYGDKNCYLAPEILIEQEECVISKSIDVWSAGCIVAELFTGRCPFLADSAITHIQRIISVTGYPDTEYFKRLKEPMQNFLELRLGRPTHSQRVNFVEYFEEKINNKKIIELLDFIFQLNPQHRPSCADILTREAFESTENTVLTLDSVIPFNEHFENTANYSSEEIKELIMSEARLLTTTNTPNLEN